MPAPFTRVPRALLAFAALTLGGLALLAPRAAHAQRCAQGASLDVLWNGQYYAATAKQGPDAQGRCFIGYAGYGANWDEWVTPARMRARAAGVAAGPAAPPAGRGPAVPPPAAMQQRVGTAYGAHDPRPCPHVRAPANRPPDLATATALVTCAKEGVCGDYLCLASNVRLQVGAGTPYRLMNERDRPRDADVTANVYSIRGSYTSYVCGVTRNYPAGQNCTRGENPRAEGSCYRDNFGEWFCDVTGDLSGTRGTDKQPPPSH